MSWMVGWTLLNFRFICHAATISRGGASFVVKFFELMGVKVPKWINEYDFYGYQVSFIAPLFVIICTIV